LALGNSTKTSNHVLNGKRKKSLEMVNLTGTSKNTLKINKRPPKAFTFHEKNNKHFFTILFQIKYSESDIPKSQQ
jgi:hypothetical protein